MVRKKKFSYYWRRKCKQLVLIILVIFVICFIGHQRYFKSHNNQRNTNINNEEEKEEEILGGAAGRRQRQVEETKSRQLISAIDIVESVKLRLDTFISVGELKLAQSNHVKQIQAASTTISKTKVSTSPADKNKEAFRFVNCNMNTCFNFSRCTKNSFKVYVYPIDATSPVISSTYQKILNGISSSPYSTSDPAQACLFVLSIDTLDRDELSRDYLRNMEARLNQLELWNGGENHVIFNLYAGTWPNYNETELGFDIGKAILAKASISVEQYRPNFDISLPLFHGTHSEKGEEEVGIGGNGPGLQGQGVQQQLQIGVSTNFPDLKKHLVSFKGKRYVYGIGSETRNSLYHLHNRKDVIMVTTCKHGKNWREMKDERCDQDNMEYEKYDYETLLQNSTFCLVPRGRRLGSFRFLEVLHAGCIPVVLSNGWVLPFSEVIDWTQAAIIIDERNLLQTLEIMRSISHKRIFQLKQQTQVLWNQYLSSIKKIIDTALEILRDRIYSYSWRDSLVWNSSPGALAYDLDFADDINRFPFGTSTMFLKNNFTAVIYVHAASIGNNVNNGKVNAATGKSGYNNHNSNVHLLRLVRTIGKSSFISKILIVWDSTRPIPKTWPELSIPLTIKRNPVKSVMQRFVSIDEVETDAIFSLDEDTIISTDEIDFAYQVWSSFPDRIVGYSTRSHYWDESNETWRYSSKWTNDYSLVLNGGTMYHIYYNYLFNTKLPLNVQYLMGSLRDCEDIVLNVLISQLNHSPPIKIIWRKVDARSQWNSDHFKHQQYCLNELYSIYGTFSFKRSSVRFDPVLYKDPVSNMRKKYRQVEL